MDEEQTKSVASKTEVNWSLLRVIVPFGVFILVYVLLWATFIDLMPWWEALLAAIGTFMYFTHKVQIEMYTVKQPDIFVYQLPKSAVIQILKDTIPNFNVGDRWWILHWKNDEKGELKFRVNYEIGIPKRPPHKQQIVLDVYVQPIEDNQRTAVRLVYDTEILKISYKTVTEQMKITTDAIDYQLKRAELGKL